MLSGLRADLDLDVCRGEPPALDLRGLQLDVGQTKPRDDILEDLELKAGTDHGREDHVAGGPAEAVEVATTHCRSSGGTPGRALSPRPVKEARLPFARRAVSDVLQTC